MLGRNGLAVLQAKSAEETAKRERDDFLGWVLAACALHLEGSLKTWGHTSCPTKPRRQFQAALEHGTRGQRVLTLRKTAFHL
ncbi:MAG: hypothetical protein D8B47_08640, partial [Kingella sp. (in: b-proteobacteria)]